MRYCYALLLTLLLLVSATPLQAAGKKLDMSSFASLPVLHEGRIKPLSRFAEIELDDISGKSSQRDPVAWLAEALFNPQYAAGLKLIKVDNSALRAKLGLPDTPDHLYSLKELTPYLSQSQDEALKLSNEDEKSLSTEQKALVKLHERALTFGQLLHAMAGLLPMQIAVPDSLGIEMDAYGTMPTYFEIHKKERELMNKVRAIIDEKGEDLDKYTEEEQQLAMLSFEYKTLQVAGSQNRLLRVVPPLWDSSDEWHAPWALVNSGQGGPQGVAFLKTWQDMAKAYRSGDAKDWAKTTDKARAMALKLGNDKGLGKRLRVEQLYTHIKPFKIAFLFYGAALLAGLAFMVRQKQWMQLLCMGAVLPGMAAHVAGLVMRIMILQRPPVGSLYESLLFVSLIVVGIGLLIEIRRRDALVLSGAAVASMLILLLVPALAPNGDDLEVLVAVLNTNFWLGTHVICITAGYGACLLTAILSHIYLFRQGGGGKRDGIYRTLYLMALISLLLTAVGTVLGGVWADQSWGRFWGWDPKENGAMLIVLWLIWLLHGRMGGQLNQLRFATGTAYLSVIVSLSWFGVNLLSVGLHSYGFISGIAWGLGAFVSAETLLIGGLYWRAAHNKARTA